MRWKVTDYDVKYYINDYDPLNRLLGSGYGVERIVEAGAGGNTHYQYDHNGNLTQEKSTGNLHEKCTTEIKARGWWGGGRGSRCGKAAAHGCHGALQSLQWRVSRQVCRDRGRHERVIF